MSWCCCKCILIANIEYEFILPISLNYRVKNLRQFVWILQDKNNYSGSLIRIVCIDELLSYSEINIKKFTFITVCYFFNDYVNQEDFQEKLIVLTYFSQTPRITRDCRYIWLFDDNRILKTKTRILFGSILAKVSDTFHRFELWVSFW